ncbi:hypothetical protein BD309DRAFT_952716 [Dichomitus squalens]|nr:hypothetical protein BD309DRAFT_952716 [Dichomitus squalens]
MQLVSTADPPPHTRTRPSRRHADAPFRIVQVPLNYSFRLLHMLVLFLFASDARLQVTRPRRVFSPPSPSPLTRRPRDKGKASDRADGAHGEGKGGADGKGHLFEVLHGISVCSLAGQRPGQIRAGTGKLYARLSSARERKLFPDPDEDDEEEGCDPVPGAEDADEDGEEGWDWEAEDDFTLSNVWPDGLDLKKGIIYHHAPETYVHITVNQTKVPGRKGTGNTPHVFAARGGTLGAVRIANLAPGPVPPPDDWDEKENKSASLAHKGRAKDKSKGKSRARATKDRTEEPSSASEDLEDVPELEALEEASDAQLERWNAADAFPRFLRREAARERAMRRSDAPPSPAARPQQPARATAARNALAPPSSPLTSARKRGSGSPSQAHTRCSYGYAHPSAASSSSSASLAPSSPSTLPIILPSSDVDVDGWSDPEHDPSQASASSDWDADAEETQRPRYSIELPLQTPFPAHPAVRRRISRVSRRLERHTSKGLSEMSEDEEEGEDDEAEDEKEKEEREEREEKGKGKGRGASPSEDATARRGPAPASAPNPAPPPVPPVVAAEGPDIASGRGADARDSVERAEGEEEDSEDEGWEIGRSIWGLGPVPPDWDSEDEA